MFSVQPAGEDRAGDLERDGDLIRHIRHKTRGAITGLQVHRDYVAHKKTISVCHRIADQLETQTILLC